VLPEHNPHIKPLWFEATTDLFNIKMYWYEYQPALLTGIASIDIE
jgi:hypothetical protein